MSNTTAMHSHLAPQRFSPDAEFEQMLQRGSVIEHLTIAAFLQRIPHHRHIDDIARFSKEVAKGADALQLAFVTTVHHRLGIVRIFPLPLLDRVYEIWAPQFRWPLMIDVPHIPLDSASLKTSSRALKANELFASHLRSVLSASPSMDVQHSAAVLLQWLEHECARMRDELDSPQSAT